MSMSGGLPRALCWFPLTPNSYFSGPQICLQNFDITLWSREGGVPHAIVCPANQQLLAGGLIYEAIHSAAGPELRDAILAIPAVPPRVRCPVGEAKITSGYKLPADYVIHVVEPIYGPDVSPEQSLRTVYRSCLSLAKARNIQFVAFPDISSAVSSLPVEEAATVAFSTVQEFSTDFQQVHFVISSSDIYDVWLNKAMEMF